MLGSLTSQSVLLAQTAKFAGSFSPITILFTITLIVFVIVYNRRRSRMVNLIEKIPGPAALPIIGNAVEMNVDHDGKFHIN